MEGLMSVDFDPDRYLVLRIDGLLPVGLSKLQSMDALRPDLADLVGQIRPEGVHALQLAQTDRQETIDAKHQITIRIEVDAHQALHSDNKQHVSNWPYLVPFGTGDGAGAG